MTENIVAKVSTTVNAPPPKVWEALVTPAVIKRYMFGTTVSSSFEVGSPITWKGEWKGRQYEDKGKVLEVEPGRLLRYSHYSPLGGQPDVPENYHTVTIELAEESTGTRVTLEQDKNATEEARRHSEENWRAMLAGLKKEIES